MKNFEIEIQVDGHWRKIKIGPSAKRGGFNVRIKQLDGGVYHPVVIEIGGYAKDDGELVVTMAHGPTHFKKATQR